ncbi:MAG: thioesterase family protein, partial [Oscillospiraceae bacterium]
MSYERKVNYYETDKMAIVHHSNYIRWFEEARIELMEHMGLPYEKMEAAGIQIPVLEVRCNYKSMVRFGDTVKIQVRIENY